MDMLLVWVQVLRELAWLPPLVHNQLAFFLINIIIFMILENLGLNPRLQIWRKLKEFDMLIDIEI